MRTKLTCSVLFIFLLSNLNAQGYFYWPYPNTGVPDSIYQYEIINGNEILDIRQYYVTNSEGEVIDEYSLSYSNAQKKWKPLSKTEIEFDNSGQINSKRYYWGNGDLYELSSVDSVFQDSSLLNLFHIINYSVDDNGLIIAPQEFIEYYLNQGGRDSVAFFYNNLWEPVWRSDFHQGSNYTSTRAYYYDQNKWSLIETDSFTFYNDLFVYTYQAFDEQGAFITYNIDTLFLDSKGRLDYGKTYAESGNSYEYVYKYKFYNTDVVSIVQEQNGTVNLCRFDLLSNRELDLQENEGDLSIYSINGSMIQYKPAVQGVVSLSGNIHPGIHVLQLRNKNGTRCVQKILLR